MKTPSQLVIHEVSANGGDLLKAARALGFNLHAVLERFSPSTPDRGVHGRPELRRFIVATRDKHKHWSSFQQEMLEEARRKFDAGTHEMCQGRDETHIIQYLIPRLIPTAPRTFFRYDQRLL